MFAWNNPPLLWRYNHSIVYFILRHKRRLTQALALNV
jgi:hypothetical protein